MHAIEQHDHMDAFVLGLKLSLAYAWAVFPLMLAALFVFIPFAWGLILPLIAVAVAPATKLILGYKGAIETKEEATPWE